MNTKSKLVVIQRGNANCDHCGRSIKVLCVIEQDGRRTSSKKTTRLSRFAHRVMIFNSRFSIEGYTYEQAELAASAVADFFNFIFKDVDVFGKGKKS